MSKNRKSTIRFTLVAIFLLLWPAMLLFAARKMRQSALDKELTQAVISNQIGLTKAALAKGANVNCKVKLQGPVGDHADNIYYIWWTPIQYAMSPSGFGNPVIAELLIEHGAELDKQRALRNAAIESEFEMVKVLLRHGANPNIKDKSGKTPLDYTEIKRTEILNDIRRMGKYANYPEHTPHGLSKPSPKAQAAILNEIIKIFKSV